MLHLLCLMKRTVFVLLQIIQPECMVQLVYGLCANMGVSVPNYQN